MVCHHCEALAKKYGRDRKGNQRFRCAPCNRTFTAPQEKPLEGMYLPLERASQAVAMLLEGMSLRSVTRLTGIEMHTLLKLLVLAGSKAERLMSDKIRGVQVADVQADEIFGFVGMKDRTRVEKQLTSDVGSFYTFVGMEATTKLVLTWHVGRRDPENTNAFANKLDRATAGRFQLSTDGWGPYRDAVMIHSPLYERITFAQLTKIYAAGGKEEKATVKRYSPSKFLKAIPHPVWGNPDMKRLCTSHIERLNLSIRHYVKRMARLTPAFSKKLENLQAMLALFFAAYNFIRPHKSLNGATPAMAHGLTNTFWTVEDLLKY